ncbi:hypothetical protein K1T71_008231 [Dendrolimus kikuchii]|uniref:Uncharacterized protein n=1 Tax=Dendrolimus kikuchii TaxID=765133 RepID=A0ACC1CWS6_9NEOP|nr:hypothetical protein K1T71_008231 [Dendrolimus kikuchii]
MDLFSEASGGGGRVLTPRHISVDKAIPHANNHVNTTVLCHSYSVQPDFNTYITALQSYAWVIWSSELVVLLAICLLYVITMKSALKHWRHNVDNVAVVLAVYPVVAAAAFLATILPRARILTEAIEQQAVMVAMYYLFCMIIADFGGFEQLERRAAGARLETRVPPCCCWPCCFIPQPNIQKRNLKLLRYLVLQMPVIQGLIYILILILWAESMMLYHRCFVYIQPFIIASILTGVWGMIMTVRTAGSLGCNARPRFFAVQLTLLIVKLQSGFAKVLPEIVHLPCVLPLNPSVFVNMINNAIMILEMLLLTILAWRLYGRPASKNINKLPQVVVAVLEDNPRSLELKVTKDGIDNRSYNSNLVIE